MKLNIVYFFILFKKSLSFISIYDNCIDIFFYALTLYYKFILSQNIIKKNLITLIISDQKQINKL